MRAPYPGCRGQSLPSRPLALVGGQQPPHLPLAHADQRCRLAILRRFYRAVGCTLPPTREEVIATGAIGSLGGMRVEVSIGRNPTFGTGYMVRPSRYLLPSATEALIAMSRRPPSLLARFTALAALFALDGWEQDVESLGVLNTRRNAMVHRGARQVTTHVAVSDEEVRTLEDIVERYISLACYGDANVYRTSWNERRIHGD